MVIYDFQKLKKLVTSFDKEKMYTNICKNIKKFRLQRYNEFKKGNYSSTINPFSTENIAELLEYNHTHYKRFESENDNTKIIPFDKLVKLSIILDVKLEDFLE